MIDDQTLRYPREVAPLVGLGPTEVADLKWFGCPFWGRKTSPYWVRGFLQDRIDYWKEELRKRRREAERNRKRYISKVPIATRRFVLSRDNWTCRYCGDAARTLDHVIPQIDGGSHDPENLVAACKSCNSRKRNKPLEVFLCAIRN